jgi:hypothetical protein
MNFIAAKTAESRGDLLRVRTLGGVLCYIIGRPQTVPFCFKGEEWKIWSTAPR